MLAAALISSGAVQAAEYDPTEVDSDTKEEEPVAIAEEEKNGWQEENGCWYYYENGEKATGIVEIGGKQYFFELQDGELQTVNVI